MNKSKYLFLGLFLIVVSQADTAAAIICKPPVLYTKKLPYHVTDVKQDGVSLPDNPIQNTWKYTISWKPALTKAGGTLVKAYKVAGNGCTGHKYECTDARCTAEISGCTPGASWVGITADIGAVSGVRFTPIYKPGACG